MKGILIALAGAWLSGLAIPGIKLFLETVSPFSLIVVSNIGAIGLIFAVKFLFFPTLKRIPNQEWPWLLGGFFLGSVIAVPMAVIGMITVTGSVAGLLFNLEIFFTFYLAFFLFKESLSMKSQIAMWLVCSGGVVAAFGGPLAGEWTGMGLIMGSCFFFALQTNILKKVESLDSFMLAGVEFSVTCVVALVIGQLLNHPLPNLQEVYQLLLLGILTYAFGNVLFYHSLKKIGAGKTATVFGSSPLLGALSAFVILGDPLTPTLVAGMVLVLVGLGVQAYKKKVSDA